MSSRPLFSLELSGNHRALLWRDLYAFESRDDVNINGLSKKWVLLHAYTSSDGGRNLPAIDATAVYSGGFAISKLKANNFFSEIHSEIEFLNILVDSEPWYFVNCLSKVDVFDEARSSVGRGLDGRVFFVSRLVLSEASLDGLDLFTLGNSNRAQLFVSKRFKDRAEAMCLRGICFREIGEVISPQ